MIAGESAPGSAGWSARPIETAVWYPANRTAPGTVLTFGDYFSMAEDLRRRSETLSNAISGDAAGVPVEKVREILETRMLARRDAAPAAGTFPVVLWSARYGTTAAQAVLSEYLASRGFVVAFARPRAAQEKLPHETKTPEDKLAELDAQTDDLRGALRIVRALPYADDERTALIAWSYAGESAWRLAQGDARIDLVIGLDANVQANWVYQSPEAMKAIDSVPARAEFVILGRDTPDLSGLAHGNFNTLEGMIPGVMGIDRVQRWSKGGTVARRGYEAISRRVAAALDATFARAPKPPYTVIQIPTADKSLVTAEVYRPARKTGGCAALFHQSGSSRGEYRTIAPEMARMGYTTIGIDVRWGHIDRWNDVTNEAAARHGTPQVMERGDRAGMAEIRAAATNDLDAALDWLRQDGCPKPIVVWGASIQANGVFELALRRPNDVGAIVDVSPGEYSKEEPNRMKTLVAGIRHPTLVMWGRTETELSKPIFDALPEGSKEAYESSGRHGNAIFFEDPLAWLKLRQFLSKVN